MLKKIRCLWSDELCFLSLSYVSHILDLSELLIPCSICCCLSGPSCFRAEMQISHLLYGRASYHKAETSSIGNDSPNDFYSVSKVSLTLNRLSSKVARSSCRPKSLRLRVANFSTELGFKGCKASPDLLIIPASIALLSRTLENRSLDVSLS
jgi:hypothetical protein